MKNAIKQNIGTMVIGAVVIGLAVFAVWMTVEINGRYTPMAYTQWDKATDQQIEDWYKPYKPINMK